MEEDRREQSEQPSDQIKFLIVIAKFLILIIVSIFQENKSYGIGLFAFILCLPVAVHHVTNNSCISYTKLLGKMAGFSVHCKFICDVQSLHIQAALPITAVDMNQSM
jgi:hypothetical protein